MGDDLTTEVSYNFRWVLPEDLDPGVRAIAEEIVRRGRRNEELGDRQELVRRRWTALNYVLGAPAAVLAAVSAAVSLNPSGPRLAAGILALASAGLGGLVAFLNPTSRAAGALASAHGHWRISSWVRRTIAVDLPSADAIAARSLLFELVEREDALMGGAPERG
jgi:hypothetical protein